MIELSLDWVMARVVDNRLKSIVPCEVQSIDITGNYRAAWHAYAKEKGSIPNSEHGMNWANVWKRLIPQLILKSAVAATSRLCHYGIYFILPERVYVQFEKLVGVVPSAPKAQEGTLTIMTYNLDPTIPKGKSRALIHHRTVRMSATEFAKSFAAGKQMPLGTQLDEKVATYLLSPLENFCSGTTAFLSHQSPWRGVIRRRWLFRNFVFFIAYSESPACAL